MVVSIFKNCIRDIKVIKLLKILNDFQLEWAVMGAHGHGGLFLFWNSILDE
jgi:hypothetical protein